jgi:hypothetical protein
LVILKDGGIAVVRSGDLLRVQREQNEEDRVASHDGLAAFLCTLHDGNKADQRYDTEIPRMKVFSSTDG